MTSLGHAERIQAKLLQRSFLIACGVYICVAIIIGFGGYLRPRPSILKETGAPMLEAELVPMQEPPQLHEAAAAPAAKSEATVSKSLNESKASTASLSQVINAQNQTAPEKPLGPPTHGPVVTYSASPKIPSYLKNEVFKTSVLIEFFVSTEGVAQPSLIGSSGNEELDAIALKSAKTWVFRPAEKDGKATDSKVRLRINFEVE